VEKEHFLDLAKNYTSLTVEDAQAVEALQRSFPYSQVVRCLASRGAHDHELANAAALLALSAVYSTDRAILKEIMTATRTAQRQKVVVTKVAPAPNITEAVEPAIAKAALPAISTGLTGDALVNQVLSDLNRLQDLKKLFESSFLEFGKYQSGPKRAERSAVAEKSAASQIDKPAEKKTSPPPPAKAAKTAKPPVVDLIPEPSSESLLNQIETSRKKVLPDSTKQKEQLEIIDKFITRQPTIPKGVQPISDAADLAEKSASLTDSMVSETLVEILLRQGKKDKAIDVLRKLIWKFPQKKAIFAAQIEDLRK
jgi:hypothetical protein